MSKFTDLQQREWSIAINSPTIESIQAECDPEFLIGSPPDTFARLENDPVLLCRIIFILCDKQRRERDISEKDFYMAVIGDAIEAAGKALLSAVLDFLPSGQRDVLLRFASRVERMRSDAQAKVLAALDDPQLELKFGAKLDEAIDQAFSSLLGNA